MSGEQLPLFPVPQYQRLRLDGEWRCVRCGGLCPFSWWRGVVAK